MRLHGLSEAQWLARRCLRYGLPPAVIALLVAGLAIRLLWVVTHPVTPVSDFAEYNHRATNLAQHGFYSADAYWPPGWPAVLAGVYVVFGVHPHLGALVGAVLDWCAILVAAWAAVRLLPPRFAACSVGVMCLYPGAIAYGPVLGTEHLAALLFTSAVVLVAFTRPSTSTAFVIGLLEGALVLTRADYGAATAVVIVIWFWRARQVGRVLKLAMAATLGVLIFMGPWITRNALAFGEFIPTSTNGGVTFYLGTVSPRYTEPAIVKRLGNTSTTHPAAHDFNYWRMGLSNVEANPLRWLAFDVRRVYSQYGQETLLLYWGQIRSGAARLMAYRYWLAIVALALVGFVTALTARGRLCVAWGYIAGSVAGVSLLKTAFVVNQRDRLPLTYLLILIAGLGATRLAPAASLVLRKLARKERIGVQMRHI